MGLELLLVVLPALLLLLLVVLSFLNSFPTSDWNSWASIAVQALSVPALEVLAAPLPFLPWPHQADQTPGQYSHCTLDPAICHFCQFFAVRCVPSVATLGSKEQNAEARQKQAQAGPLSAPLERGSEGFFAARLRRCQADDLGGLGMARVLKALGSPLQLSQTQPDPKPWFYTYIYI